VRFSLLCFYYRLIDHISIRKYIWVLHTFVAISVAFLIAYVFALVFSCTPIDAYWTFPPKPGSKCIDVGAFLVSASIINTILELVTAILPIPVVLTLQMEKKQRWSVISLLSLGFLVVIIGCIRTYFVWLSLVGSWDANWWSYPQWICSEVENNVALVGTNVLILMQYS
jgi:hypothetical protein